MIVSDLEAICRMLPGDLAIHIVNHGPCGHIQEIDWRARHTPSAVSLDILRALGPVALVDGRHPQALVLRSYDDSAWWTAFGADVEFTPRGLLAQRLGHEPIQPGALGLER